MRVLRQIFSNVRQVLPKSRAMHSGSLVGMEVDSQGIATVTMKSPPVNCLNLELLQDLIKAFDDVEKNNCKGMILTSAMPTVFSAGLDIKELYKPDLKRAEAFWTALQEMWIKLFGSKFVTAAAINGHSPAGGCIMGLCCEYRVMVNGPYTIGMNETKLGIVAVKWAADSMIHTLPMREAEIALTMGTMFSVDEALKVGLIDESATDKTDAIEKCKQFIRRFNDVPSYGRGITKQYVREGPLKWMQNNRQQDKELFLQNVCNPKIQQDLEAYMTKLKERKAAKSNK